MTFNTSSIALVFMALALGLVQYADAVGKTWVNNLTSEETINLLRSEYLIPPPPPNTPLNLNNSYELHPSFGQTDVIRKLLKEQRNGFFVEVGAFDGESYSNTLVLERELNWTGLLIEGNLREFANLVMKLRNAYLSHSCISPETHPIVVSFHQDSFRGRITEQEVGYKEKDNIDVQCFPLLSYLQALNRTRVDYFSLDIEGLELEVLKTIPFDEVDIRTLSVEWITRPDTKDEMRKFMESKGYVTVHENSTRPPYPYYYWTNYDWIFYKQDGSV